MSGPLEPRPELPLDMQKDIAVQQSRFDSIFKRLESLPENPENREARNTAVGMLQNELKGIMKYVNEFKVHFWCLFGKLSINLLVLFGRPPNDTLARFAPKFFAPITRCEHCLISYRSWKRRFAELLGAALPSKKDVIMSTTKHYEHCVFGVELEKMKANVIKDMKYDDLPRYLVVLKAIMSDNELLQSPQIEKNFSFVFSECIKRQHMEIVSKAPYPCALYVLCFADDKNLVRIVQLVIQKRVPKISQNTYPAMKPLISHIKSWIAKNSYREKGMFPLVQEDKNTAWYGLSFILAMMDDYTLGEMFVADNPGIVIDVLNNIVPESGIIFTPAFNCFKRLLLLPGILRLTKRKPVEICKQLAQCVTRNPSFSRMGTGSATFSEIFGVMSLIVQNARRFGEKDPRSGYDKEAKMAFECVLEYMFIDFQRGFLTDDEKSEALRTGIHMVATMSTLKGYVHSCLAEYSAIQNMLPSSKTLRDMTRIGVKLCDEIGQDINRQMIDKARKSSVVVQDWYALALEFLCKVCHADFEMIDDSTEEWQLLASAILGLHSSILYLSVTTTEEVKCNNVMKLYCRAGLITTSKNYFGEFIPMNFPKYAFGLLLAENDEKTSPFVKSIMVKNDPVATVKRNLYSRDMSDFSMSIEKTFYSIARGKWKTCHKLWERSCQICTEFVNALNTDEDSQSVLNVIMQGVKELSVKYSKFDFYKDHSFQTFASAYLPFVKTLLEKFPEFVEDNISAEGQKCMVCERGTDKRNCIHEEFQYGYVQPWMDNIFAFGRYLKDEDSRHKWKTTTLALLTFYRDRGLIVREKFFTEYFMKPFLTEEELAQFNSMKDANNEILFPNMTGDSYSDMSQRSFGSGSIPMMPRVSLHDRPRLFMTQRGMIMDKKAPVEEKSVHIEDVKSLFFADVLSWDYFHLEEQQIDTIPDTFANSGDYIKMFKKPLLNEVRAQIVRSRETYGTFLTGTLTDTTTTMYFVNLILECSDDAERDQFKENDLVIVAASHMRDILDLKLSMEAITSPQHALGVVMKREKGDQKSKLRIKVLRKDGINVRHTISGEMPSTESMNRLKMMNFNYNRGYEMRIGHCGNLSTHIRECVGMYSVSSLNLTQNIFDPVATTPPPETSIRGIIKSCIPAGIYNQSQLAAIEHALSGKGFRLVQGPPGTGKTHVVLGILSCALAMADTQQSHNRILVCAPSNTAVNEIASRVYRHGLWNKTGTIFKPKIVCTSFTRDGTAFEDLESVTSEKLFSDKSSEDKNLKKTSETLEELFAKQEELRKQGDELRKERSELYNLPDTESDEAREKIRELSQKMAVHKNMERNVEVKIKELKDSREKQKDSVKKSVLMSAQIIFSTLSSSTAHTIHSFFGSEEIKVNKTGQFGFHTVLIDEAAQAVELSTLVPLQYAVERCILVGDPAQLSATVLSSENAKKNYNRSLFERLAKCGMGYAFLDTQYRMHNDICSFPSTAFYGSKLVTAQTTIQRPLPEYSKINAFGPMRFFDLSWTKQKRGAGLSLENPDEADFCAVLLQSFFKAASVKPSDIGVITFYKNQVRCISDRLRRVAPVDVKTVDSFQGGERDVIVISCVRSDFSATERSKGIGFVSQANRLNVALTRARYGLWVVGNATQLGEDSKWKKLIDYCKEMKWYIPVEPDYNKRGSFFKTLDLQPQKSRILKSAGGPSIVSTKVAEKPPPAKMSKSGEIETAMAKKIPPTAAKPASSEAVRPVTRASERPAVQSAAAAKPAKKPPPGPAAPRGPPKMKTIDLSALF